MELSHALLESIRYEHWLRFYFMAGTDDVEEIKAESPDNWDLTAKLEVPAAHAEASRLAEPYLYPLLQVLQGGEVSLESSRDAVFRHAACVAGENFDDPGFGAVLFQLVSNPDFRRGLDAFHGWVQELANGDVTPNFGPSCGANCIPTFAQWQAAFKEWEQQESRHVTTISPFGVQVQFGSGEQAKS